MFMCVIADYLKNYELNFSLTYIETKIGSKPTPSCIL